MPTPLAAASAYATVARLADPTASLGAAAATSTGTGNDFSAMLKHALEAVHESGQKSDSQVRAAANGNANMVDVVTAVSETEVAIDAVVAVRDKVIAAYEEVMKMAI
jgi:flagellar hook-basal body complex protein FliE